MKTPSFLTPLDIEKTREEINSIISTHFEYSPLPQDMIQTTINAILYVIGLKIDKLNYIIAQNYLPYSSGEFLEELVSLAGLTRTASTPPYAQASITAKGSTKLAKGSVFLSSDGVRAYLANEENLKEGENEVLLMGEKEGKWDTSILQISNPLITSITLLSPFTIQNNEESDEALKKRFLSSLHSTSTAGSLKSYEFFASIEGVEKVKAIHHARGEVKIFYLSQIEHIQEKIREALKDNTPTTDIVHIEPVSKTPISLTLSLTLKDSKNFSSIHSQITQNLNTLFSSLEIGEGVSENLLIAKSFVSDEVLDVRFNSFPSTPAIHELLILESTNITQGE